MVYCGIICFHATLAIKQKWQIDVSLDVFPVHGVGGILGTLLAGVFSSTELGVFSGYGFADGVNSIGEQLSIQAMGVVATGLYTAMVTFIVEEVGMLTNGIRVSEEDERKGLIWSVTMKKVITCNFA